MFLSALVESGDKIIQWQICICLMKRLVNFGIIICRVLIMLEFQNLGFIVVIHLLFGTHTATKDHAVAVLSDGAGYRDVVYESSEWGAIRACRFDGS